MNKNDENGNKSNWTPKGGLILKQIEFDRRILNDLRELAEADGVKSVYQMIRNACYQYVQMRKRKAETTVSETNVSDADAWSPELR